jgi:hypothetical protein
MVPERAPRIPRLSISQRTPSSTSTIVASQVTPTKDSKETKNAGYQVGPEQFTYSVTRWVRIRRRFQDVFSEFFGTFIFLLFSFGVTAQVTLSKSTKGDYLALCFGWGYIQSRQCLDEANC